MRWYGWAVVLGVGGLAACGGAEDPAPAARPDAAVADPRGAGMGEGVAPAPAPAGDTPMEITGDVGGQEVDVRGTGACQHAADGSIYQRPADLWTARFVGPEGEEIQRLNLTFWRERSGTESVNFAIDAGSAEHRISTVQGGTLEGRARAALEGGMASGVLTVDGTSGEGVPIRLQVRCERFTTLVAEGG